MQKVRVHGEGRFAALVLGDRDLVLLGEIDQLGPRGEVPFAPGGDHLDIRIERVIAELEADLIVALAGGAVADGVRARRLRDLDLALGDQRPSDRGAEQIDALVKRIGSEHREDEIADEFLAQIFDEDLAYAEHLGLLACGLQLLALAQIRREGHDLAAIGHLQPFEDDRSVQTARIGQHHLFDFIRHDPLPRAMPRRPRSIG